MRILHMADLHLGKTLHGLSLIDSGDQPHWIDQILDFVAREKPDAVVIAGDVYDRGVPVREAIPQLSRLLTGIARMDIPVFMIAGNHDGGERLEFMADMLQEQQIYIAGTVRRDMIHVTIDGHDGLGPVTFWLMPYLFPAAVRQALDLPDDEITSYTEAARRLLAAQPIDDTRRNVLIAHQTVLNNGSEPEHSQSETAIGGVGGIDPAVFSGFDYVALGHIHGAQRAGSDRIRYAGSPLCYHFSEAGQKKGPLLVTLGDKAALPTFETYTLTPLHRVRETMRGKLQDILTAESMSTVRGEYVRVELTDPFMIPNAREQLTALFESHDCRMLDLSRDPEGRENDAAASASPDAHELSLQELFLLFYQRQTGLDVPSLQEQELIRFAAHQICDGQQTSDDAVAQALAQFALKQEVKAE